MSQVGGGRGQEKDRLRRRDPGLFRRGCGPAPGPAPLNPRCPGTEPGPLPIPRRGPARPLRPGPPTWPDVGPGPRPRCSAPRCRVAHEPPAPRPGCPAGSAGRATTSPWQPGGGGGLAARLATRQAEGAGAGSAPAGPHPGPGPAPRGAWSGDRAPPGPNLDAGMAGTAARDPRLQRPGLRTRARVTFECGPRDLASGVRCVRGRTGLCCPAGAGAA